MNMRDEQGYPLEGIDVVPIRPKVKKPNKMAELMKLLQEANRREEKANTPTTGVELTIDSTRTI